MVEAYNSEDKLKGRFVMAHRGYYNKNSWKMFSENSLVLCRETSAKSYIDIIELDVRKSKDGVLFCYHGSLFEYYITLKFRKNYSEIKERCRADKLAEILDVIPDTKIVFLDIKDTSITRDDIYNCFANRIFAKVLLANMSVRFLGKFDPLPEGFSKVLNGNILSSFYNFTDLKRKGFGYVEGVLPFLVHRRLAESVRAAGMQFSCASLFYLSEKAYWKAAEKYDYKYVSSDFI